MSKFFEWFNDTFEMPSFGFIPIAVFLWVFWYMLTQHTFAFLLVIGVLLAIGVVYAYARKD